MSNMLNKAINKHCWLAFLAIGLLLTGFYAQAQTDGEAVLPDNIPGLLKAANQAYASQDYLTFRKAMQRVNAKRPYNSEYMYQLVIAYALLDEKRSAYDLMLRMQRQGLAYDFSKPESTLNIRGTEVFDFVNDMLVMASQAVGESEPVFTLPAEVLSPEAISWDESRQKFLIGTISEGSILAVGKDGQVTELFKSDSENGMWAVLDILVDQRRNTLWVTSAAVAGFSRYDPVDKGRSALFEYNLETLQLIRRYPVPVDGRPHSLGSMVLSPQGDIYIADRVLPFVFAKLANQQKLKAVAASTDMISMRGIAMRADGSIIYIADRELGILMLEVESGQAAKLVIPDTLNIGGIDGLYLWDNHLVIVQNGIKPQRIMRLQLDTTGTKVEAVRPLAVAQPAFDFPSYGTIIGEDLYYFANSHRHNHPGETRPVTVLRTPLDSSKDIEGPDMQAYLQQRGEKLKAKQ